ncbi:hypothetical protein [Thalassospira lucentensis]|uniref:hypothetical protein n=1 Tax=Thalassospira lucentensis TaxID=168935 RepID=UPI000403014F|nr:hypothetical protein [Thalassospira lucentensis]RCK28727.1 hypothetical protein TH1_09695 [Thalassospira lucentensis MCCC 1A00383 = DSM 14000]
MSKDQMRKPGRAPGRFVTTKTIIETRRPKTPVAATPIKRFDRKDAMERDLDRYRADARARLLRNGFDVPAYLMPKPPVSEDEEGNLPEIDPDEVRDVHSHVMTGPKPAPLAKVNNAPLAPAKATAVSNASTAKPSRHVHVQGGVAQKLHRAAPVNGGAVGDAQTAGENTAYQDYIDSLDGGPTLLDHMRGDDAPIKGRVDDLKSAEETKSRIDLPDNSSSWVARDGAKNTPGMNRSGMAKPKSGARRPKRQSAGGAPLNWNKVLPKIAAYMVAAVGIGYVLVLTVNQFSVILGK